MLRLTCKVQNYAWGNLGSNSLVGKMHQYQKKENSVASESTAEMDPDFETTPFAEFWMGDHVNGPSCIQIDKEDPVLNHIF